MRFLADMGVSLRVAEHLRTGGHDVCHLSDEGLQRLPDGEIFQKATAEKRVVLTFDLDFGEIAARCTGPMPCGSAATGSSRRPRFALWMRRCE